jgi:two-component system chemotaxis response regulator CheY
MICDGFRKKPAQLIGVQPCAIGWGNSLRHANTAVKMMNVLIVDDNEMTRTLLRTILNGDGYKIMGDVSNSKSGLEQALKLKPDIVCLDILMPDGSGIDVLKRLTKELPKTVVLMVTGKHDVETVKECLTNGAKGFIIKPFNAAVVLKVVKEAVQRAAQPEAQA